MNGERWRQVQTLFHQAADLPKSSQGSFLESECREMDAEVAEQILAMLEEDDRESSPLDGGITGHARHSVSIGSLPRQVGPYQLGSQLGYGGMGVVYLAYHSELESSVAIKFLRDAWMSPYRAECFCAEQKTLAKLNHPSIARLYEAGTLPDGTPWFAMEYVEGASLTDYCERNTCGLKERLLLFRSVCQAVQYAHSRAVIHRDLKPSNILVKEDGTLRLLDFGISKQMDSEESTAQQTRTVMRLFTPAYAAPEQLRGESVGVFTDIYALGVILRELLAGQPPAQSHSDRADLQVLCSTATHPDIDRRYASADALLRDVDRFLNQEPLAARPDSFRYRARKFVERQRKAVIAAAVAVALVSASGAYFTLRLQSARQAVLAAASRRERVERFMLDLFNSGDTWAGPSQNLRVVSLLDRGVKQAESLSTEPAVQAQLYRTLGVTYQRLGKLDRADTLLHLSLETCRRSRASDNELAESLVALGLLQVEQAKLVEGEKTIRDALARADSSRQADIKVRASCTAALGKAIAAQAAYKRAIPVLEEAVRLREGEPSPELAASLRDLAGVRFFLGEYGACDALTKRAMAMHIRFFGENHPSVADDLIDIANVQVQRAQYKEAEPSLRRAVRIYEGWYGPDHPETASSMTVLSQVLFGMQRNSEARELLTRALTIQEKAYGPVHPRVGFIVDEIANVALEQGRYDDAESGYKRALAIYRSAWGAKSLQAAMVLANLGSVYLRQKDYARAEAVFRKVVAEDMEVLPSDHFNTGVAQLKLGHAMLKQNRFAEAEPHVLACYRILNQRTDSSNGFLVSARKDLAIIYKAEGQSEKAKQYGSVN